MPLARFERSEPQTGRRVGSNPARTAKVRPHGDPVALYAARRVTASCRITDSVKLDQLFDKLNERSGDRKPAGFLNRQSSKVVDVFGVNLCTASNRAFRRRAIGLALGVATFSSASAQTGETSKPANPQVIQTIVQRELERRNLPGAALAITRGGRVVQVSGYGRDSNGRRVTPDTPFYIASTTQTIPWRRG